MVGPARFLPIVLGFFFATYYATFGEEAGELVETINRTLITILLFWIANINIPYDISSLIILSTAWKAFSAISGSIFTSLFK